MSVTDIVFGRILKNRRAAAKMSQEDLAEHLDLSRVSVANFESGQQSVSLDHAVKIASVLKFSLGELEEELKKGTLEASLKTVPKPQREQIEAVIKEARKEKSRGK